MLEVTGEVIAFELIENSEELTSRVALTELLLGLVDVKSLLPWNQPLRCNNVNIKNASLWATYCDF